MKVSRWCLILCLCTGALALNAARAQEKYQAPRGRAVVVTVQNPEASQTFRPRAEVVRNMVDRGLAALTSKATASEAWLSLVSTQDTVGIKVFALPGPNSGTRPAVVAAVVEGLLAAGMPAKSIIVWDKHSTDLRLAGFYDFNERYGIRVAGSAEAGYDEDTYYDTALIGNLLWGDLEFGKKGAGIGRKSFVSRLVSKEMTRIINIVPMLNHNHAGVSGNLYSLASGSVDNFARFEGDSARLATAVPEIYALPALSDRVVLNIVDGLLCQYEGGERGLLHYTAVLNEIRLSRDPVALDVLSVQELDRQRKLSDAAVPGRPNPELFANAALLELGVNDPKRIEVKILKE